MKQIQLTKGFATLIDDADFDTLSKFKWQASQRKRQRTVYAYRGVSGGSRFYIHREILNAPAGVYVDHINGDGLDNRRQNLRLCQPWQNIHNIGKRKTNTSGFKGVCFNKKANRWQAQIEVKGKSHYLGLFGTPESASKAYQSAAAKLCGGFNKQ